MVYKILNIGGDILNREDFEILKSNIIYFDNAATTMKPNKVVNKIIDYYTKYTANAHRGDYDNSLLVDTEYENVRNKVKKFINATSLEEIVFTKGSTESFNMIIFGFMSIYLKKGDEVLLTKSEHASNILPWITLSKKVGFTIKYIELTDKTLLRAYKLHPEVEDGILHFFIDYEIFIKKDETTTIKMDNYDLTGEVKKDENI